MSNLTALTVKTDSIVSSDESKTVDTENLHIEAYANFYYAVNDAAGNITIASGGYGTTVPFNNIYVSKNITGDTTNNNWTHSYTGAYLARIRYRQTSGGDVWSAFAVTKNGANSAVGVTARTGSEDSHNEAYDIIYKVDDITATYQIQGWAGSGSKVVLSDMTQGSPSWDNYRTLIGGSTGDSGRMVDFQIYRLGDLNE